jgi:hypothetical protein
MLNRVMEHAALGVRRPQHFLATIMNKSGMSILEVIISSILLLMIVAGFAGLFTTTRNQLTHSRLKVTSGELGKYLLDPLHGQVRFDQWGALCVSNQSACPAANSTINIQGRTYTYTYNVDQYPGMTLPRVVLRLRWTE